MLKSNYQNFYISTKLAEFSDLIHGFSTREFGDMRLATNNSHNRQHFAQELKVCSSQFVYLDQIYDSQVGVASLSDAGSKMQGTDGLITGGKNLFLFGRVADCLPILFYDLGNQVVGLCHAGWQGTIKKISLKMVQKLVKNFGTNPKDLIVAFGPSIGPCHYEVQDDVVSQFEKEFSKKSGVVQKRNEKTFVDLRQANLILLTQAGVLAVNIDSQSLCTFCHNDIFYSYRKEKENLAGEIGAMVGLKFNPQSRQ